MTGWRDAWHVYLHRRVLGMLFLGFSSGLPLPLVFFTFLTWLAEAGVSATDIGLLSGVGLAYAFKVLWSPLVDRLPLPFLTRRFGQRRGWMLFSQAMVAAGLAAMAATGPDQLTPFAFAALWVAVFSATQDVAIDAYRIEAVDPDRQGAMAATYVYGYRLAMIVAVAGALYTAQLGSWPLAYFAMAACMSVGVIVTLIIAEPVQRAREPYAGIAHWVQTAVVGPFVEFFVRNGARAFVILALVSLYLMSDYLLGIMAGPFYIHMGYSKIEIANVAKVFGTLVTIVGAGLGGLLVVRYGVMRMLLVGAVLIAGTNLAFAWLSASGEAEVWRLAVVIMADNLSGGMASVFFIAYMSSLTNTAYTATQYALFSSLMKVPGKIAGLFSGFVVDAYGYTEFFIVAAASGLPAILLVAYLMRVQRRA